MEMQQQRAPSSTPNLFPFVFFFSSSMLNFTLEIKLYSMYALTGPLGLYRESEWTDKGGSPGLEHDWIYAGIFTGSH